MKTAANRAVSPPPGQHPRRVPVHPGSPAPTQRPSSPPRRPPSSRCAVWLLLLTACGQPATPGLLGQALEPPPLRQLQREPHAAGRPAAVRVPLAAAAGVQLEAARSAEVRLRELEPRQRLHARLAVAEAWRAAAAHPEASAAERMEALFGAGRCLSALGFHGEAESAYEAAAQQGGEASRVAEAWLEAAHSARRAGRSELALGRYERAQLAAQGLGCSDPIAAVAALWAARVELDRGGFESAELRLEALAESSADPLLRLAAFDELALLALAQADPGGAAGWIQRAREQLAEPAAAQTESGRRLRRALAQLRALPELALAIAERARDPNDATGASGADSQLRFLLDPDD